MVKFKVLDKSTGEWIDPGKTKISGLGYMYILHEGTWFVQDPSDVRNNYVISLYTGLDDKNGVGIYQGDRITGKCKPACELVSGIIQWDKVNCGFSVLTDSCHPDVLMGEIEDIEVVYEK